MKNGFYNYWWFHTLWIPSCTLLNILILLVLLCFALCYFHTSQHSHVINFLSDCICRISHFPKQAKCTIYPRTLIKPFLLINYFGTPIGIFMSMEYIRGSPIRKALTKSCLQDIWPLLKWLIQYANLLLLLSHQARPQLGHICLVIYLT